jgi:hypothetical protein
MKRKRLLLRSLLSIVASGMIGSLACAQQDDVPFQVKVAASSKQSDTDKEPDPAQEALKGQWIVRFVKRDGLPNAAQIGQQIGDIISIEQDGNQLGFG